MPNLKLSVGRGAAFSFLVSIVPCFGAICLCQCFVLSPLREALLPFLTCFKVRVVHLQSVRCGSFPATKAGQRLHVVVTITRFVASFSA